MFGHLVVNIFGPWGEIIAVLHRIILAHTLCRWIAKRVRQMSRIISALASGQRLQIISGSCVTFQKQETGKVIKREGVTKDVPTWFD